MSKSDRIRGTAKAADPPRWSAVYSLTLSVFCFVTAELLPVSLLTPMASALRVTEGMAGQAVTTTALVALVSSLMIAAGTRRLDRRVVVLSLAVIFTLSNVLVATASNYAALLAGRILLGLSLGGFWSMCAAVTMRLVSAALLPRALAIIFGGVSAAMAIAAPLGTFLGGAIGWRGVFFATAVLGLAGFFWELFALPSMSPRSASRLSTLWHLMRRPKVGTAMLGMMLVFGGHFAFFTYMRPYFETITQVDVRGVSALLFVFGVSNVAGTFLSGAMLQRSLLLTLGVAPLLMSAIALALVALGHRVPVAALCVAGWGFAFGTVPVAWTTWLTRHIADETESAGGLQVAAIQLAITGGAGIGGLLIDSSGVNAAVIGAGCTLLLAAFWILLGLRSGMSRIA